MSIRKFAAIGSMVALVGAAWALSSYVSSPSDEEATVSKLRPTPTAPPEILKRYKGKTKSKINGAGPHRYTSEGMSAVNLNDVSRSSAQSSPTVDYVVGGPQIDSKFTDEQIEAAVAAAQAQAKSSAVQNIDGSQKPVGKKIKSAGVDFNAIDAADCCTNSGFSATVPPDPDMAAGPNHLIVVVNIAFEIYDKQGNSLTGGPIPFADFFNGTPGCTAFDAGFAAVFDPDVVYDTENDRFVIGIDGNGTDFCVAASQTGDPLGGWNRYGFPTNVDGAFFDFPHMGVGEEAIFMGSNQFGGALPFGFQGRVFAMNKDDMYNGAAVLQVVTRELAPPGLEGVNNVKLDGTPQPAQQQPVGTPFYIMSEFFDGKVHSVYSWDDPFGADVWTLVGDVDLAAASGVPCEGFSCFPISWPQKGSVEILAGNDFRGQETEFRNGYLWTTQTISCNPGKGTRNCVRWAQIDPTQVVPAPDQTAFPLDATANGVIQAGVFGSTWDYRSFPSIAANDCNDMAVGYSYSKAPGNSGGTWFPSIFVNGRQSSDPLGYVSGERLLKKGDGAYSSFQDNGGAASVRWGDYTGMTLDPDGKTFWYAGQFAAGEPAISVISGNELANWGTYVGSFEYPGC
ncbi:MAG: hypothetical protein KJO95_10865 [Gammaproteobacteria bacterium]|nr:hypothetical protein [Gammaproteobacteria bacterium]